TSTIDRNTNSFSFQNSEDMARLRKYMSGMQASGASERDAAAYVAFLDSQKQVDKRKKIGTQGYCMGGPLVFRTAASLPDRVGAGASFHGGGLVTDKPDSPHLLVPKIKAHYLFAIAQSDDEKQPEAKTVLKDAFAKAKLPAEIEVYPAMHGWCPPDSRVYDKDLAEKAW